MTKTKAAFHSWVNKTAVAALLVMPSLASAQGGGSAPDYSVLAVDQNGAISATPQNLTIPMLTNAVIIMASLAGLALFFILGRMLFRLIRGGSK